MNGIGQSFDIAMNFIALGNFLELGGKFADYNRVVRATGETFQNLATLIPITATLTQVNIQAPFFVKVAAGLGGGVLGLILGVGAMAPLVMCTFMNRTTLIGNEEETAPPALVKHELSNLIGKVGKGLNFITLIFAVSLGHTTWPIAAGLASFTVVNFITAN